MLKKKQFLISLLFITLSYLGDAQTYFGIKGNYSLSFARAEINKYDDAQDFLLYHVEMLDQDVSPGITLFTYFRNDPIYIQAELSYRRTEINFLVIDALRFDNLQPQRTTKRTDYIQIPIHGGLQYYNLKLGAGALVSLAISENIAFEEFDFFEERRRKFETGFTANIGLVFKRLQLELSYEYQTGGIADYIYFREDKKGFTQDVQFVNLGLGLLF